MLEYLRNAADKPVAKILMGVLIFSFVGWGVAEWVFGLTSSDTTLMRVGGDKVSIQQYNAKKSNELAKLSKTEQRTIYTDPAEMAKFQNRVIGEIAAMFRMNHLARDFGYVVSEHRIAEDIRAVPQFQENGKFSAAAFDRALRGSGMTESDISNDLRTKELEKMVLVPVTAKMATPRFATTAAYNARNAKRNIDLRAVKFAEFKTAKPTEEQLREFYAQNPHRVDEARDISYVIIAAAMDKPDDYERGLKVAQKLEDDVIAGDEMSAVAKKHNAKFTHHSGISANKIPADKVLTDALISRVFNMDEGTESELIETKDGFVIVRVDKIIPEHTAQFESVKKELATEWTADQQRKQAYVRANELLVDLNKTGKLADAKRVSVSRTDGAKPAVLVAAFQGEVGNNSIVSDQDAFYVMRIVDEKLPTVDDKKLEAIKPEVSKMAQQHITADYNAYMERKYPTKINEKTYNRFVK